MSSNQDITKQTYEDPKVVNAYIQKNALALKQAHTIDRFAKLINGKKLLDLGCGPGHESYAFAERGFEVTGLDYSNEMIRRAREFKKVDNQPTFMVGDIRNLNLYFSENTFDAIWAAASLIHIPRSEIKQVLKNIVFISKPSAKVFVALKGGNGEQLVEDIHLGRSIQREFVFWEKETFAAVAQEQNLVLEDYFVDEGRVFMGHTTQWLKFIFSVHK